MTEETQQALQRDKIIDITTTGRRSGAPRRIEIWFHRVGERYIITGSLGPRDWYANLLVNPRFTFHLKDSARADLPARARPIIDPAEKRRVLQAAEHLSGIVMADSVEAWVARSPIVEVLFEG